MGWKKSELPDHIRRQVEAKEGKEQLEKITATKVVGIDPGTQTGLSVYDSKRKELEVVTSGMLIEMYHRLVDIGKIRLVRIEDARKRTWFGNNAEHKQQGAGSIKRDSKIWEEICQYHDFRYEMVHPQKGATKLDAKTFKQITGWQGRTNEHKRDSAMLVYGYG